MIQTMPTWDRKTPTTTRSPDPSIWIEGKHGPFCLPRLDRFQTPSMLLYGEYCEGEVLLLEGLLHEHSVVVEGGACLGLHTIPLARRCREGFVQAFEPQECLRRLLHRTLEAQAISNVYLAGDALGDKEAVVSIDPLNLTQINNAGGSHIQWAAWGVQQRTIDSLDLKRCDLIKLDCEGSEPGIVRGATRTLEKFGPFVYLEADQPNAPEALHYLLHMGYRLYWHIVPFFNPMNWMGVTHDAWPGLCAINALAVPLERVSPLGEEYRILRHDEDWHDARVWSYPA